MKRRRLIQYSIVIISLSSLFVFFLIYKTKSVQRDVPSLLNQYYRLIKTSPWEAKEALSIILQQDPDNFVAIREMASWYIAQGDTKSALNYLQLQHKRFPKEDSITLKLTQLYLSLNQKESAHTLLKELMKSPIVAYQKRSREIYRLNFPLSSKPKTIEQSYASYVEPVSFFESYEFDPLYERIQQIMQLQPDVAEHYLRFILSADPHSKKAYLMMGYLQLQQKKEKDALKNFLNAFAITPDAALAAQIGFLMTKMNQLEPSEFYFNYALLHGKGPLKIEAQRALSYVKRAQEQGLTTKFPVFELSEKDKFLLEFYENKKSEPRKAWKALTQLLKRYPTDLEILKEAAYFADNQHQTQLAIQFWQRAYLLENNPEYALSIAYLYDSLHDSYKAFYYFHLAAKTNDKDLRFKAEIAMTNLAGAQTKYLPDPFFAEIYTAPFYFSRFELGVLPVISRAGITFNKKHHTEAYLSYRRTQDSRSGSREGFIIQNSISQIFEDNVAILSMGLRTNPLSEIPLQAFVEVGQAEDLIYRERRKWRNDVRGGLVYFNRWGAKPTFSYNLEFPFEWVATLYADAIYYSRYDNNIIGTAWFRPGINVANYRTASLKVYLANYLILDKNHEFYNNVYSIGPGIAVQPTNRLNVVLRFESLQAFYIPVNGPSPNPYGPRFYNNVTMLETYFRF